MFDPVYHDFIHIIKTYCLACCGVNGGYEEKALLSAILVEFGLALINNNVQGYVVIYIR